MKHKKILDFLIFLAVFSMLIPGCKVAKEEVTEIAEETADTGALVVESSPGLAHVYIGEEYKGDTPVSLYNLPVGQYEITVKKEGYIDAKKTITIKVGRTEEVDATLTPIVEETKPESMPKAEEKTPSAPLAPTKTNKINLSSFAMYYDFDNMEFTELRTEGSDLFSRKYETYMHFTTLVPTKINMLDKPINEAEKEDCIFADTAVAQLFSGQTLCIKTGVGAVFAIGGTWQAMPTELELKSLS